MRYSILTILLLSATCSIALGQGRAKQYTTPLAGQVTLSQVQDKYNAQVYSLEMPDPDEGPDEQMLRSIKEQIAKLYPRKSATGIGYKATSVSKPVIANAFIADSLPGIPPDSHLAVSNDDSVVGVINESISVFGKGGKMVNHKYLLYFSKSVGLSTLADYRYDPKVIYDPEADRFISIMLNSTNGRNYIIVAFSQTNSPSGKWNFYTFYGNYGGDTTWFDFPQIAITKDEFFFTGNKIKFDSTWQAGFKESVVYQVKKQDGYNGDSALHYQIWDSIQYNGKALRCLFPVNAGGSLKGPAQYFLSNRDFDTTNDTTFLVRIQDTLGSTGNSITVTPVTSPGVSYGVPPDARQPDTAYKLATNDGRVLGAYQEGDEIQFVSASLVHATGASGIYFGKISGISTATPSMQANIITVDTLDFGYPNISFAGKPGTANQSIICFDYSGSKTYPGMGAVFYDGANFSPMTNIMSGDSSIEVLGKGENRWGDYMGSQPSWRAIGNVWVTGIYGRADHNYGNYIAKLTSPYYTGVQSVTTAPAMTSAVYPNPAWQFLHFRFDLEKEGAVNFFIYDAQGRQVDKLLSSYCSEGKNVIQFNIAPLSAGTYFLKVIDEHGKLIGTHSFIKQ